MRLTLIHPCIGRRKDQPYIRLWQMEPLPPAAIAGLTPPDVEIKFYDDRMERIPYDEPTDLVGISVETYTAKRAYQISSEYHATLWSRNFHHMSFHCEATSCSWSRVLSAFLRLKKPIMSSSPQPG